MNEYQPRNYGAPVPPPVPLDIHQSYQPQDYGVPAPAVPDINVTVYPVREPGKLLAYAHVDLGGIFAVNNIRIYNSAKGPFVAMPSTKGKDGQYHDICCPTTKEMRDALHSAVLGAYQQEMSRPSVRGALQEASRAAARPAPNSQRAVPNPQRAASTWSWGR